jgi:hypothetical protein
VTPAPDSQKNFLVVDAKTDNAAVEAAFDRFIGRKDIGIILINQHASPAALPLMTLMTLERFVLTRPISH